MVDGIRRTEIPVKIAERIIVGTNNHLLFMKTYVKQEATAPAEVLPRVAYALIMR